MPFQSDKQRRYLWANEPEIAREWTDRYGARGGGIMRIPFAEGSGEGVDYNDYDVMIKIEELKNQYPHKYANIPDEQMVEMVKANEVEEIGDWYQQDTLQKMWQHPDRPEDFGLGSMTNWATDRLGSGINWGREKIGAGIDWGKMAMRGIGNFIAPGLGFVLGALPRDTAADKFNRRFTVGGANMPKDPYGYYNQLRHGNINQDPFGRNPVSMFGNYSKSLLGDVNYSGDSKFKKAKADYAQNYFNQKAAQYAPQEDVNIGVSHFSGNVNRRDNDVNRRDNKGSYSHADDPGTSFYRGGIASLWPR